MANPQIEDGYIKIATEIQDAFCHFRIPGEERQVLDTIIRKTYGWNKCEDAISLSQFVEATGMNKPHVIQAIKGLLLKKVISVTEKGNDIAKVYKFNKNYEEWIPLPKKVTLPKKVIVVTEKGNLALPKKVPTKDTITKYTITKERVNPTRKTGASYSEEFLTFWDAYPKRSGSKKAAFDIWRKLNGERPDIETILHAITIQTEWRARASPGEFRPEWKDPERWIKNRMWEADVTIPGEQEDSIAQWLKQSSPTQ